jgi:hypothetical protein
MCEPFAQRKRLQERTGLVERQTLKSRAQRAWIPMSEGSLTGACEIAVRSRPSGIHGQDHAEPFLAFHHH